MVKAVASKAGQSPDRRVRPVAEGSRRSRRPPHQRRRLAGAHRLGRLHEAAKEMAEQGTFTELANGYPGGELNKMFS